MCHHQRRFRVIVNVHPELVGPLETTGEFKYGRIEGQTPTLEQFNGLLQDSMGPQFCEVSDPTWLTYFIVQERMVSNLRHANRLFLAGDATHCHSPAGGQGMNMGIQDGKFISSSQLIIAHNLAWKLALVVKDQAVDTETLLESYTAEVNSKDSKMSKLILAAADYPQNCRNDCPDGARNDGGIIEVLMGCASYCSHGGQLSMATTGSDSGRAPGLHSLRFWLTRRPHFAFPQLRMGSYQGGLQRS